MGSQQGGVVLLRPCVNLARHMMSLVRNYDFLRFSDGHAEQSFQDWYFRYSRWILPIKYNAISHNLDRDGLTRGGNRPIIAHFTNQPKPIQLDPSIREHSRYLAYLDDLNCPRRQ